MLCEAILVDADYRSRVEREVIRLVEGNTLRYTIDIHTLHRTVTLHDAFTSSGVRVTTRLSTTRKPLSHLDLPSFVAVVNSLINKLNSFSAVFFRELHQ